MLEEIKVYVVKYGGRKNLMMRYLDPMTGKQIARTTGTDKKREAERVAAKWEAQLREGRYQRPSSTTWEDFRDKYEMEVLPGLADTTANKVAGVFNSLERILNPSRVNNITPSRLSYLIAQLRNDGLAEATIGGHLAHLKAALGYAVDWGYLPKMPELPKLHRVKRSKTMKGRPITTEEFERMLNAVDNLPEQIEAKGAGLWKFFLRGLWSSGLRIGESLNLYWDRDDCEESDCLEVQLDGRRPLLVIPAELEKGNEDRLLPMAPEFAELLKLVPIADRHGPVFKFRNRRTEKLTTIGKQWASKMIVDIGKKAGVVVNPKTKKCASAHDLRRAFGQRWAALVMPQILMQLMRHADITTTMKYYVGSEAEITADVLWEASNKAEKQTPVSQPLLGNTLGNTSAGETGKTLKNKLGN